MMPRRNPEDVDLAAIKADLEFIIEQQSKTVGSRPSNRST